MTDALKNDELADELYTLVQQIQPSPTFLVELEEQFNQEKKLMRNKFSRLAWISVIVAVLLGALVLSPTLRGLAQDVWRFFVPGESDTQTTTTHAPPENQSNLMSHDVAAAPFAVWYPDAVPGAYALGQTTYDASGSTLIYECNVEGWGFAIRQHPLSDEELATEPYFGQREVGASASIESVSIHDVTGEYVRGEWTPAAPPDGTGTQEIELVWNSTVDVHHLAWVEDGFLFEVFTSRWSMTEANNGPCAMTKDDFVAIAQSLK